MAAARSAEIASRRLLLSTSCEIWTERSSLREIICHNVDPTISAAILDPFSAGITPSLEANRKTSGVKPWRSSGVYSAFRHFNCYIMWGKKLPTTVLLYNWSIQTYWDRQSHQYHYLKIKQCLSSFLNMTDIWWNTCIFCLMLTFFLNDLWGLLSQNFLCWHTYT